MTDVRLEEREDSAILSAAVVRERDHLSLRAEYRYHGLSPDLISTRGDTFVAGLLVPALFAGEDLTVEAPVSPLLLRRVDEITSLLSAGRPHLAPVKVLAPAVPTEDGGSGIGLFFSGGVDSYYSLLKNMAEHPTGDDAITHLIFAFGYDTRYGYDQSYMDRVSPMIREVAQQTGKEAIVLECNLRSEIPDTRWQMYHGSALISIGLALSPLLRRCLIASSVPQGYVLPWGSHSQLDPLWSTEALEIVHDDAEVRRTHKVSSQIAHSQLALRTLRVCFEVENQPKNCGRCSKCLQTMIALHAAGALESCSTFLSPLDVKRVRNMRVRPRRTALKRLLEVLGNSRYDRRLARAIRFALWKYDLKQAVKRGLSRIPRGGRPAHQPD